MNYRYKVAPGDAINMWQMNGVKEESFKSPYKSFDHEGRYVEIAREAIDMRTIGQIIYPVREAFLEEDYITDAPYVKGEFKALYFPWANRKVDFSSFCHDPKVLSNYVRCYIECDEAKTVELEVRTCGGVKLWVNEEVAVLYKAYERNVPNAKTFSVNLEKGVNELLLYANDLAERDVFFYFEMTNSSNSTLDLFVPIEQKQSEIEQAKKILESIYFEKDTFIGEEVTLCYDASLLNDDRTILCGNDKVPVTLLKDKNKVIIGDAGNRDDQGFGKTTSTYFPISLEVNGLLVETVLYLATYNIGLCDVKGQDTIAKRKEQALQIATETANEGEIGTALAMLAHEGRCSDLCRKIIEIHLQRIEKRLDCADFRLPVILLIVKKYGDLLPQDLRDSIKNAVLNFRYWCTEPGNDVMWFFSENHSLLFYVSQYLAGDMYPNEVFVNSGRESKSQKSIGYNKIVDWFEGFLPRGYDEWNSLTYLPVDCIAFFTLFEIAPDQNIREYAKKGLDLTFEIIAANMHHKAFSSSYGRTYEHTLKGLELGELSMYAWIAWNQGTVNVKNHAVSLFADGSYEPAVYESLRNLNKGQAITVERVQGSHKAYTYIHKCKAYSLASTMKFHPLEEGLQQHFINLSFSENEMPIWFNHPGEKVYSGHNRPSYWGGWQTIPYIEQYENTVMACVKMREQDEVDFIHANIHINVLDHFECSDHWFIFCKGDAYGAFWFANGFELTQSGANTNKEIISRGTENAIIIKCGSKEEFDSYEGFKNRIKMSKVDYIDENNFTYHDPQHGVLNMNLNVGLKKDGELILREAGQKALVTIK